ncbi:MAG: hypothetical protein HRU20_09295 [Pseudomonadales bacterium]|nr:hypothetical protein [Pseudomonadales bacterium]
MKVVYVLWPDKKMSPSTRRSVLLENCGKAILDMDTAYLSMNIDDEFSTVKSPAPKWYKGDAIVATVSVIFDDSDEDCLQRRQHIKNLLNSAGFKVGMYIVDASIYKDYGDNPHFRKRDWADGEKTPSVVMAITLLTRPKKYPHAEWIQRWHGRMSPGSEVIQPRARYVRNVVLSVEDESPHFDGIVEESWPSAGHISNPYKFYLADNTGQLIKNMVKMILLVTHFHQLHKIRTVTMSEYFLKTNDARHAG